MTGRLWMIGAVLTATLLVGNARSQEAKKEPAKDAKVEPKKDAELEKQKERLRQLMLELEKDVRTRKATVMQEPMPLPPSPYGFGTPYTQGPPAYGWGYGWGNPWPANWGPASTGKCNESYNYVPYYEPMVLPPHLPVITLVQPTPPFVPVRPTPDPRTTRTWEPRRLPVEVVPTK